MTCYFKRYTHREKIFVTFSIRRNDDDLHNENKFR